MKKPSKILKWDRQDFGDEETESDTGGKMFKKYLH